jgi:hypothetical protein
MVIQITGGEVMIDASDLHIVNSIKWHVSGSGYAVWRGIKDGKKQTIRMHRLITNCPKGLVVDHINHNPLDNRRDNIRVCTQSDNMRNRSDQGKGYWKHRKNNNWVVEIHGKHICCVPTEDEAREVAALVRNGGVYSKPIKGQCKYGHHLFDAYIVKGKPRCRQCQAKRSREYYLRRVSNEW